MEADDWTEPIPVRRVVEDPDSPADRHSWPATLGPIRQVLDTGLALGRSTVLVGANGVGKSTLVEAIASCFGMGAEGGSTGATLHATMSTESRLHDHLRLVRGAGGSRWGYFIRAETMHGLFTFLASSGGDGRLLHQLSHGESFLTLLADRSELKRGGLIVLDEPEAGLSFESQLTLLGHLIALSADPRAQVIIATHSPVVAALPGARLLELSVDGIAETDWSSLAVVDHYRRFTQTPEAYLRHLR